MNFVKSSVYQQEITAEGVKEKEIVTRSKEEIALEERLKNLPEFQRQNHFLSFAEVRYDDPSYAEKKEGVNTDAPAAVTEEEFEYYEALAAQERRRQQQRQREEKDMQNEFLKAKKEMEEQRRQALNAGGLPHGLSLASSSPAGGSRARLYSSATGGAEHGSPSPDNGAAGLYGNRTATPQAKDQPSGMGARIFDLTSKRKRVATADRKRANPLSSEASGKYRSAYVSHMYIFPCICRIIYIHIVL
ncbi:hypothetical protein BESB_035630 [Besnoitia besnoiti]|uniref:Uncharacterized protein n=1 Tax=Besnoitia besnoiti TaxID=94643 RepID=A0A2A9MGK2_BESBE|nr:hypothetical protein BESB_035630 [Besnoitia besnoiti]PFH37105.1 hypothetical protein BESB_035630 [Besnoitia besnoiti]